MNAVNEVLERINRHADNDEYFLSRFIGWLSSAAPEFVAEQLGRLEASLQQMVDAGDRSVIHGWDHLAELQIDDVQIDEVPS